MGGDVHDGTISEQDVELARAEWRKYSYFGNYEDITVYLREIEFHRERLFETLEAARNNTSSNKWDQIAHAYRYKTGEDENDWAWYWQGSTPS